MTYRIINDDCPENPREIYDTLGIMVCWHGRYNLGDCQPKESPDEWLKAHRSEIIALPLYMYDHSGIALSTSPFASRWDSGQIGYIYATKSDIRRECGVQRISPRLRQRIYDYFRAEVTEYSAYVNGDAYAYEIIGNGGEVIDSCYGYYDYDACEQDAINAIERMQG